MSSISINTIYSRCEVDPRCNHVGPMRPCGHYACDSCTDLMTDYCAFCVPIDDGVYAILVQRNAEA